MCRHVYELKEGGRAAASKVVQGMIDIIILPATTAPVVQDHSVAANLAQLDGDTAVGISAIEALGLGEVHGFFVDPWPMSMLRPRSSQRLR